VVAIAVNKMNFTNSVFINCPFDNEYLPLLKPLLFILIKLGFNPRIALERSDSGEIRLNKILELIESSKFSIHDLSRSRSKVPGEYYRLNMPFELGLDLGCKQYNIDVKYRGKKFLILEEEKYSTQKSLSDLSFADCKCHNGEAEELVYEVRNWFVENIIPDAPSASSLWDDYNYFYAFIYESMIHKGLKQKDINRLPIAEFIKYIDNYLNNYRV
jgi:hypothetical protein